MTEAYEKQHGLPPRAGRTRTTEPVGEARPQLPGNQGQTRPAMAIMDLARQEKSLEALGRMLKTKREINGLTRRDVVIKIKIPMDQLESIEDGRLSALPPVFAKGFLRAYANELGLDAEAILDDYRKMTGGFKNEPPNRGEALATRYVETKISSSMDWRLDRWLAAAVVFLCIGLALWAWPGFRRNVIALWPGTGQAPETALIQIEGEPQTLPAFKPAEPAAGEIELTEVSGSLAVSGPAEEEEAFSETEAQQGGELTLVSQRDGVWLQIVADDQPVKHYWLKRGQNETIVFQRAVVVRTNQGTALNAVWNGRELGPLSGQPVTETSFPPGPLSSH